MSNRQQRRAQKAVEQKLPIVPNISGDERNCGNCKHSLDRADHESVVNALNKREELLGAPDKTRKMALDETACMLNPGGGIRMKIWGFCWQWKAP